ncbi:MAG TPA: hypothetical protein PKY29_04495 [Ferruginibacter sp.]|nr:hypothetical protein [Ferruginibacter sp.]HRQ20548.1 hypothetical protein [Ferruginibacter sp.]
MSTTITSSEIVSQFGEYYIDAGQNENNIHQTLRESFADSEDFTVIDTEDTVLREVNTEFTEVLQPFQTGFTPKGSTTFLPKEIKLFNVKVDQSFYPDALKNRWIAFLTSNNLDRTTWPFVRWFIEQYVLPQISHDMVKNLYGAVYASPTPGTAGAANTSFNGLKQIINAAITAGDITPITTGTPSATPATWAGQVESFCKSIPELYWDTPMGIQMSRALGLRYKEGRRIKYNSNYAQISDAMAVQDFESMIVKQRGSLTGTSKIWATPKANAIMAFKGGSNRNIVEVEKVDRIVKVYTDFWFGIGFINHALVFTNDQDIPEGGE